MSERKRNNPNMSMFIGKQSASISKSNPHNLTQLNETIRESSVSCRAPVHVRNTPNLQMELDFAYNSYLQALFKQEIVEKEIKKQEKVLDGQILLQEENVRIRQECFNQIQKETDLLIKKEEIVKTINNLEETINKISGLYGKYETKKHLDTVREHLTDLSGTLVLKNIKFSENDHEKLVEAIKKLNLATEKIVKCGRDFEGVHKLAEDCRNLIEITKKIKESHVVLSSLKEEAELTILQKLSDEFAKQYDNFE